MKSQEGITETISNELKRDGFNLNGCSGQSHANEATMPDVHLGVQRGISDLNIISMFDI